MLSIGTLGSTLPLGPKSLKVKHQAFPHDGSTELKRPLQPAHLSQITITGPEPRVQLDVAGRSRNFLVDTEATYPVLSSYCRAFSSQTCTILGATGKATTKRFTQALLCCWDGQIFSHQFLVVPECPTPLLGRDMLTKLGTTLVTGSFSAPRTPQLLVTTDEPITPSPKRGNKTMGGQN